MNNIREAYNTLLNAFKEAGLNPDITIWVHDVSNKDMNKDTALDIIQAVTDTQNPKTLHYDNSEDNGHSYSHMQGQLPSGELNLSFPLVKVEVE